MLARFGLVFVAHDQHGELGGEPDFLIKFAQHGVLVCHQRHLPHFTTHCLHQKIALPVDGAKALLLDLEQLVGRARGFQTVAEIGAEHSQFLPFSELRVMPEQAFYLPPGKEVGMDDLVGIAAQQEVTRGFERFEYQ